MLLFEFNLVLWPFFFSYFAYIFSLADVTQPQRVRLRWRSRGQQGTLGKKEATTLVLSKTQHGTLKSCFSERRRTPNLGRSRTRRGVPCRKVDGVGPNFSPGDLSVVGERSLAIMSVPSLPVFWLHFLQTNTQEKRLFSGGRLSLRRNGRSPVRGRGGKHDEGRPGTSGSTAVEQLRR